MPPFPCLWSCFACASRTLTFSLFSSPSTPAQSLFQATRIVRTYLQTTFNSVVNHDRHGVSCHSFLQRYYLSRFRPSTIDLYDRPSFFGCSSFTRVLLDFGYSRFGPHFLLSLFEILDFTSIHCVPPSRKTTLSRCNNLVVVRSLRRSQTRTDPSFCLYL
jgi:hypothetical protein